MKQLVVASSTNLTLLGVGPEQQLLMPLQVGLPRRFNPNYAGLWQRLAQEVEKEALTPDSAWDQVVKRFVRECLERHVNPFHPNDPSGTGAILTYLLWARKRVVKYIDDWGILGRYPNRRLSEELTLELSEQGLKIRSQISLLHIDLSVIRQELTQRRFFRFDGPYKIGKVDWRRRILTYPLYVGFSASGNQEGILWYELQLPHSIHPQLMGNDLLFNHEERFGRFVRRVLWAPVVRLLRFRTLNRISHF